MQRSSSQDFWSGSQKVSQKSSPRTKDHSERGPERLGGNIWKGLNYWDNLVWLDETKIELLATIPHAMFGGEIALHMTLKIPYQQWCFRGGSIMVWSCFSSHGTGRIKIIEGKMNGAMYWEFLRWICCHPPGWWRWDFGEPSTRMTIQNTLHRRVWIGSRRRK